MRKLLARVGSGFQISLAYRSEIFLWFFLDSLPVVVMLFVWSSIYSENQVINGYTLSGMVLYYLCATAIDRSISAHFAHWRVQEIRQGKIDFFLVRPFTYIAEILTAHVGGKLLSLCISLPLLTLLFFWAHTVFQFTVPTVTITSGLQILGLLLFGFVLESLIDCMIVILGFWLEEAGGLEHFKWISVSLFSGFIIPLVFLPEWLQTVASYLPFQYMYAVPIGILQGTTSLEWSDYLYLAGCLAASWLMLQLLWKRAVKIYTSVGG